MFILRKTVIFQSSRRGGWGGVPTSSRGGGPTFTRVGVRPLISMETYITFDLPAGS